MLESLANMSNFGSFLYILELPLNIATSATIRVALLWDLITDVFSPVAYVPHAAPTIKKGVDIFMRYKYQQIGFLTDI